MIVVLALGRARVREVPPVDLIGGRGHRTARRRRACSSGRSCGMSASGTPRSGWRPRAPCTVTVCAGGVIATDRTFQVAGHHYAIVVVTGLEPASSVPTRSSSTAARPGRCPTRPSRRAGSARSAPAAPVRILFGSCREPEDEHGDPANDPDVLSVYANRMASQAHEAVAGRRPDAGRPGLRGRPVAGDEAAHPRAAARTARVPPTRSSTTTSTRPSTPRPGAGPRSAGSSRPCRAR